MATLDQNRNIIGLLTNINCDIDIYELRVRISTHKCGRSEISRMNFHINHYINKQEYMDFHK